MNCSHCGAALPGGARFCPACGSATDPATPSEERKLATVLFADLVSSTALGASQDPERTRAMLDRFYDAMAAEIARAGGTVEKFVGDAVMAVFGAPAAQEDHAERALHAALAMRRRLAELFGGELSIRIGVNTGEVVVGRPREGSSFVTGDAVNVCARLEQHVEPGGILVGERTAALVRGAFEFDEAIRVDARGRDEPVVCRRLVRGLSLMRPRGVGGLRPVFVGRDAELELLDATYRRVVHDRRPHLVTIMAEAGVGKTRLVRELWERLGGRPEEPLRRTGRCLSYGEGITYWPLGEIVKEHFGLLDSDDPETAVERLSGREILGLALGLDVAGDLHPLSARDRLHEAWIDFIDSLVADRPAVLLVEDVHWAEAPLLDLLDRTVREVSGPLLVLATARPELLERRPAWGSGRRNASLFSLEPLSSEDAARLVDEELAGALPARLRELVVARAEGNPFFVEELVATLIDQGLLERANGGWQAREVPEDFAVPDSVQAVLAARIDLLPPVEKAALQAASVVGRTFWAGPVRELLEGAEPDFDLLEERDFVRRRPGSSLAGEREWAIKHALTREVAYAGLTKMRRAHLHAAFARWLERLERPDEVASLLAHHYAAAVAPEDADLAWGGQTEELARLRERAVVWLRAAAALAVRRYELDDGISLLHRALSLEPPVERRADLWRDVGHAHALRYDGESFWEAMQHSLAVCTDRTVCGDTYSLLAFHTSVRSGMWRRRPEQELVESWVEQALDLAQPGSAAHARALIARAMWKPGSGGDAAREAAAIAERLGDTQLRSWAFAARSAAAAAAGSFEESWTWSQRRFDLLPAIEDPDHAMEIHENLVPASAAVGRLGEARRLAEAAREHARPLSPHHRVHGVALRLEVEELDGRWDAARGLADDVRAAVAENLGTPCARNARSLLICAAAEEIDGDGGAADELEQAAEELRMEGYEFSLEGPRIRLALARGRLDRVEELVAVSAAHSLSFGLATRAARLDALAALRLRSEVEEEAPPVARAGTYLEPFALRALAVVREDEELLRRAQERFEEMGLGWHAEQTRVLV